MTLIVACSGVGGDVEEALIGVWEIDAIETDLRFDLKISKSDGWFDSHLQTNCGMRGLLSDWREIEVDVAWAPKGEVSGSIITKCVLGVLPARVLVIESTFFENLMVGRVTAQEDRGNMELGPAWVVPSVHLFVASKQAANGDGPADE